MDDSRTGEEPVGNARHAARSRLPCGLSPFGLKVQAFLARASEHPRLMDVLCELAVSRGARGCQARTEGAAAREVAPPPETEPLSSAGERHLPVRRTVRRGRRRGNRSERDASQEGGSERCERHHAKAFDHRGPPCWPRTLTT